MLSPGLADLLTTLIRTAAPGRARVAVAVFSLTLGYTDQNG